MKNIGEILTKYGSDKNTDHSYGKIYHDLLSKNRRSIFTVLEIGIKDGASLRAWAEYFPNALIYGIDIELHSVLSIVENDSPRIIVYKCDGTDVLDIIDVFGHGENRTLFDLIIDDGSHYAFDQKKSFNILREYLTGKGIYVIEDIVEEEKMLKDLEFCKEFSIFDLRKESALRHDILMVYKNG